MKQHTDCSIINATFKDYDKLNHHTKSGYSKTYHLIFLQRTFKFEAQVFAYFSFPTGQKVHPTKSSPV